MDDQHEIDDDGPFLEQEEGREDCRTAPDDDEVSYDSQASYGSGKGTDWSDYSTGNESDTTEDDDLFSKWNDDDSIDSMESSIDDNVPVEEVQGLRIATWNVQTHYHPDPILEIMTQGEVEFITLQEPNNSSPHTQHWVETSKEQIRECGYEMIVTPHNIVIMCRHTLHRNKLVERIALDGRVITHVFKIQDKRCICIISVYGVCKGDGEYVQSSTSKKALRKAVTDRIESEICTVLKDYPDCAIYIMGDLQEQMSKEAYRARSTKGLLKEGILKMLVEHKFRSPVFEQTLQDEQEYVTWEANSGTGSRTGIDWIWTNDHGYFLKMKGGVDPTVRNVILSDHDLVWQDVNVCMKLDSSSKEEEERVFYHRISRIKVTSKDTGTLEDGQPILAFDESQFRSRQVEEDEATLRQLQELCGEDNQVRAIQDIIQRIHTLKESIVEYHQTAGHDRSRGELPPRRKEDADGIQAITSDLLGAIHHIVAHDMKLSRKSNRAKDEQKMHRDIKASRKSVEDHVLTGSTPRRISKAISEVQKIVATMSSFIRHNAKRDGDDADENPTPKRQQLTLFRLGGLAERCQNMTGTVDAVLDDVKKDVEEFEENLEAVEFHRPTDRNSRERERAKLQSKLSDNDMAQLQGVISEAGCPEKLEHEDATYLGTLNRRENDTRIWAGPSQSVIAEEPSEYNETWLQWIVETNSNAKSLVKRLKRVAAVYKDKRIHFEARMNRIGSLSRMLLPKARQQPEGHPFIQDENTGEWKRCETNAEILKGTEQVHSNWMGKSKAKRECHYLSMAEDDVGPCGVIIEPDRPFTEESIKELIAEPEKMSEEERQRFIDAHAGHIGKLLEPPEPREEFFWPVYVDPETGVIEDNGFKESFWKAIEHVPGKARHDGFHLAVIGRMSPEWQYAACQLSILMLVTRTLPPEIKVGTRVPIPKPVPGETRPLTLLHDLCSMIYGMIGLWLKGAVAKAGNAAPELAAYKPGRGCDDVTLVDLAAREDAIASGQAMACIDEDEMKMFDRITVILQCAVLLIIGCPEHGFVEMKADDLYQRTIIIVVRQGRVVSEQTTGLMQGSCFSVEIANPVLELKHLAARLFRGDLKRGPLERDDPDLHPYTFSTHDAEDGSAMRILSSGYSDDNLFYIGGSEEKLPERAQDKLDNTGDFSLVCQMPRNGSKSGVTLINVSPSMAKDPPEFVSVAWSFVHHRPVTEKVTTRIHCRRLKEGEVAPTDIDDFAKNIHTKSNKHLGILSNIEGDTQETAAKILAKVEGRFSDIRIFRVRGKAMAMVVNALITPVASYSPLLSRLSPEDLDKQDRMIVKGIRKGSGLTATDSAVLLSVSPEQLGHGFRLFLPSHIAAVARELEVSLNDTSSIGIATRSRLSAHMNGESEEFQNYVRHAIQFLARYGIFLARPARRHCRANTGHSCKVWTVQNSNHWNVEMYRERNDTGHWIRRPCKVCTRRTD